MKKKIVNVLLSMAVITAMLFSVTACGAKDDEVQDAGADTVASADTQQDDAELEVSTAVDDDVQEESTTEADTQDADAADAGEPAAASGDMTLEEWIASDECAQFSEMMNAGLEGMVISFEVEGDTISMIFTMEEALDVADDAQEAMNEYFTSNSVIFEAIRDQLISETGNENTVLKLVYRNADDSEIFSMDF